MAPRMTARRCSGSSSSSSSSAKENARTSPKVRGTTSGSGAIRRKRPMRKPKTNEKPCRSWFCRKENVHVPNSNQGRNRRGRKPGGGASKKKLVATATNRKTKVGKGRGGGGGGKNCGGRNKMVRNSDDLAGDSFVVDGILGHGFTENGERHFLIRWEGYAEECNSWEPLKNLDCPDLLAEYEKDIANKGLTAVELMEAPEGGSSVTSDDSCDDADDNSVEMVETPSPANEVEDEDFDDPVWDVAALKVGPTRGRGRPRSGLSHRSSSSNPRNVNDQKLMPAVPKWESNYSRLPLRRSQQSSCWLTTRTHRWSSNSDNCNLRPSKVHPWLSAPNQLLISNPPVRYMHFSAQMPEATARRQLQELGSHLDIELLWINDKNHYEERIKPEKVLQAWQRKGYKPFDRDRDNYAGTEHLANPQGYMKPIYIRKVKHLNYALFSSGTIPAYNYVLEMQGMICSKRTCSADGLYGCDIGSIKYALDTKFVANIARFINHSCDPNLHARAIEIGGEIRVVLLSLRNIGKDEQLTWSYGARYFTWRNIPCLCTAKKCRLRPKKPSLEIDKRIKECHTSLAQVPTRRGPKMTADERWCCYPDCGKFFQTRKTMMDHVLVHKDTSQWYKCIQPGCFRKFSSRIGLMNHEKVEHTPTPSVFQPPTRGRPEGPSSSRTRGLTSSCISPMMLRSGRILKAYKM